MADKKKAQEFYEKGPTIDSTVEEKIEEINKEVYIFVSFDLVNSTQLKAQYPKWLNLIKKLIDISKSDWLGLNFWKFNGDELLYYAKITAVNQLLDVLRNLCEKTNQLTEELRNMVYADLSSNYAEDLIGVKTAIWIASFEGTEGALNSKLEHINTIDFAGVNMDEGFRMSKCAIQNKIIVDPKIAFIICLIGYGLNKSNRLPPESVERLKTKVPQNLSAMDLFELFSDKQNESDSGNPIVTIKDSFARIADNLRMIGYEECKGVWNKRKYPIIWYSESWNDTKKKIKYDETYLGKEVSEQSIELYYKDSNNSIVDYNGQEKNLLTTYQLLEKIYNDIGIFKKAIYDILLLSQLKLCTRASLDIQVGTRSYIYYSVVCIKRDVKGNHGVLTFLRSNTRGHLPNTWDFEQQKNAQSESGEEIISQIEDKFENNFGVKIRVVKDDRKSSLIPMDIHPVYRRGNMHNGILCFAYIEDDLSEEEIVSKIKEKLNGVISGYGYPMYSDACFVHKEQLNSSPDGNYFVIDGNRIDEISNEEVRKDSSSWNKHDKSNSERCITNFVYTVLDAIDYKGEE